MSTITPANFIFARLSEDPIIAALVNGRILPRYTKDLERPYIIYSCEDDARLQSHGGMSGTHKPTYMVQAWAESYDEVDTLKEAIHAALDNFVGNAGGLEVQAVRPIGGADIGDAETGLFGCWIDFQIWHRKATS